MDMAAITASLEKSLNKCSLNSQPQTPALSRSSSSALDLNSQLSLPYHWEQCLDLKSGEVYYMNWRTGTKSKDDPRSGGEFSNGVFYSEDEDDDEEDDSSSSYDDDDDESSTQSSPNSDSTNYDNKQYKEEESDGVLVVAGCKICLMYFMVPKLDAHCPKCSAQLLHFPAHSMPGA